MASIVDDRGFNQGFAWTPTQEVRMRRRADAILQAVPPSDRSRMLELGCGTGELASFLASGDEAFVTGVDLSLPFVEDANRRFGHERLRYVQADLSREADRQRLGAGWSAIVGNGILHHLYGNIDAALHSMKAMLTPGGRFVFWEPNLHNPYVFAIFKVDALRRAAKLEPDEMAFSPRWIRQRLGEAGFVDVTVRCRDFLAPVVPHALVPAVLAIGDVAERVPVVAHLAQSLFISARAPR